MKAKDTIVVCMSGGERIEGCSVRCHLAQAEISFKAGYKEALEGAVLEGGYESVKRVGIREVVEWIKRANKSGDFYYSFDQAELEAQIKEWGI